MSSFPPLPATEHPLVLRTDFTDPAAWQTVVKEVQKPVGLLRFRAYVNFLDDPSYNGLTPEQLPALLPEEYEQTFIFLVDSMTIQNPEHPLLVVDLFDRTGQAFRTLPREVQAIENNLSIANMDFEEFAAAVDEQGIFRGFPRP